MRSHLQFQSDMLDLHRQFSAHDAQHTDRLQRYRNIETESAQLLNMLIGVQQTQNALEIGTSTGYSTLWLAEALVQTQGQITTLEIDEARSQTAQHYAKNFELDHLIDFKVGDALRYLANCDVVFDFILLDAERDAYVDYWQYLPKLLEQKNGLLVVDNVLSHADQVAEFISLISCDPAFKTLTMNIGAGLLLVSYNTAELN